MGTRKSVFMGIIYFLMFPICFRIANYLLVWRDNLGENIETATQTYLATILVGILAGVFLCAMLMIADSLFVSCKTGKWIVLIIIVFNLIMGIVAMNYLIPEGSFFSFNYFSNKSYYYLICILLVFQIVRMALPRFKNRYVRRHYNN